MQYVRSIGGSVSKTWNSINPATLSGAIDVVVVEQEDGSLACSPFHVRFGKFSLLRPSDKKVEFRVNGQKQDYSMKLGDGGEAFFVFETTANIPVDLQTSPVLSPSGSPQSLSQEDLDNITPLQEPELLSLDTDRTARSSGATRPRPHSAIFDTTSVPIAQASSSSLRTDLGEFREAWNVISDGIGTITPVSGSPPADDTQSVPDWSLQRPGTERATTEELLQELERLDESHAQYAQGSVSTENLPGTLLAPSSTHPSSRLRSQSPPAISKQEAITRAMTLSKKLSTSNIKSQINETGDLMLDMEGYKSSEADALRAEMIARKVLAEELQGNYDIGALIGADERGNLWIYSSEEAKDAAARRGRLPTVTEVLLDDAASDPGHQSDDERSLTASNASATLQKQSSDRPAVGIQTPPKTPEGDQGDVTHYAKTLRLTSDQLKALSLKSGRNPISFTVNRATCQASMHYWTYDVPVVISDIDGTITKSDALGHVLNMLGRDWTHPGVAKLFKDITSNGYNIMYLTSRSVGQADTTRAYLEGINQEGHKLPLGPVILSPDRTIAALRREVYLRKPEVFKMSCLRDIASLFGAGKNPFYAGFGNRLTDALSYRSVNIPSNRIFTINPEGSVSIDILTLNTYKSSYVSMRELVPHFFPPVGLLVKSGGEKFTDFSYWRSAPLDLDEFTDSEDEDDSDSVQNDHDGSDNEGLDDDGADQMTESFMSRESIDGEVDDMMDSILDSIEDTNLSRRDSLEEALDAETPIADPQVENGPPKRTRIRQRIAGF